MNEVNAFHDCVINDYAKICENGTAGDKGEKIKKLVDKVEQLKFLRMKTMYDNMDVLDELVCLTDKLREADKELKRCMREYGV